jgi:hypothetical protein
MIARFDGAAIGDGNMEVACKMCADRGTYFLRDLLEGIEHCGEKPPPATTAKRRRHPD